MQVDLALNILDGAPFREDPSQVIRVQRAKFEQKGSDYVPKKKGKSKKKAAGVLSKQEKELGWGGFDDKLAANKVSPLNSGQLASSNDDDAVLAPTGGHTRPVFSAMQHRALLVAVRLQPQACSKQGQRADQNGIKPEAID